MAKTVAFLNMKGGVGKSTLAVNFAQHLAGYLRKRVLLVDIDPQSNASQYALGVLKYADIVYSSTPRRTAWDIFERHAKLPGMSASSFGPSDVIVKVTQYQGGGCVDLIPSRLDLASSLDAPARKEDLLQKFLSQVDDAYDVVVIDCPPTESLFTTAAYLAAQFVVVPVKPEFLSTIGLPLMLESLDRFTERYSGHSIEVAGIVFNATSEYHPEETKARADVQSFAAQSNWPIFKAEVAYTRSLPKGARLGQPLFHTSHTQKSRKTAFYTLTCEIAQRIGL